MGDADNMVERVESDGKVLAIVVRAGFDNAGCTFATPNDFALQLGVHVREGNTEIKAHKHVSFKEIKELAAQEFFYVEKGKVEVGLYEEDKLFRKIVLNKGDMVVLNCAHDVKFLEDTKMIELKQGPYRGKEVEKKYF